VTRDFLLHLNCTCTHWELLVDWRQESTNYKSHTRTRSEWCAWSELQVRSQPLDFRLSAVGWQNRVAEMNIPTMSRNTNLWKLVMGSSWRSRSLERLPLRNCIRSLKKNKSFPRELSTAQLRLTVPERSSTYLTPCQQESQTKGTSLAQTIPTASLQRNCIARSLLHTSCLLRYLNGWYETVLPRQFIFLTKRYTIFNIFHKLTSHPF
jgi:hypothetical protein